MKKLLLSIVLLTTTFGFSQEKEFESPFTKGKIALGGSLRFNKSDSEYNDSSEEYEATSYSISPSLGYFIEDNIVVGLLGRYYKSEFEESSNTNNTEMCSSSLGFYLTKYYKLYHRFYFSVSGDVSYTKTDGELYDSDAFVLGVSPSLNWALNKNVAIEIGFDKLLGYSYSESESGYDNNKRTSHSFFSDLGDSTLSVGFRYYL